MATTGIYWCLVLVDLILSISATELVQTSPPHTPVCPNDKLVVTCTTYTGDTYWKYSAVPTALTKLQNTVSAVTAIDVLILNVTGIMGNTVTSTGTIQLVNVSMNGIMVSCSNHVVNGFVIFIIKMTG